MGEQTSKRRERRRDNRHDKEHCLPRGEHSFFWNVFGNLALEDIDYSLHALTHLGSGSLNEVLVELESGEEQLRALSIPIGVDPQRLQFATPPIGVPLLVGNELSQ